MESIRTSAAASLSGLPTAAASSRQALQTRAPAGEEGGAAPTVPKVSLQPPVRPKIAEADPAFDPAEMRKQLEQMAQMLNEQLRSNNTNLAFGVDPTVDRTIITVTERNSGDVVRQIPGEVFLRVARTIERLINEGAGARDFKGVELDELF